MFKNGKLDYPNATTDKASKKFLKGMKNLEVRLPLYPNPPREQRRDESASVAPRKDLPATTEADWSLPLFTPYFVVSSITANHSSDQRRAVEVLQPDQAAAPL